MLKNSQYKNQQMLINFAQYELGKNGIPNKVKYLP